MASDNQSTINPRLVAQTKVTGLFGLPMGIRFLQRDIADSPKSVLVSTVLLEDAHLEDPLRMCEPEHGYQTMVFLDGCTFFSVFTEKYEGREEAARGHGSIVERLLTGELPLAIPIGYYNAWDQEPDQCANPYRRRH